MDEQFTIFHLCAASLLLWLSSGWDNPPNLTYRPKSMRTTIEADDLIESTAAALQYIS